MNDIDDLLWLCYKTFPENVVDNVDTEKLAAFLQLHAKDKLGVDAIVERIHEVRTYRQQLAKLQSIPYIAQRTPEWYDLRKQRLTASDTAQAIGKGKFGTRDQLVQKKVNEVLGVPDNFPRHLPALKWGVMFEAMASRCYSQRHHDINIHEFGLIPHPSLNYYGASPDGITDLGVMIEIKCPYKRKITGDVPDYYELQIQGQMAVCGLRECDYVECEMQEFESKADYLIMVDERETKDHGVIVEYNKDGDITYDYSEPYLTPIQAYESMVQLANARTQEDVGLRCVKLRPWRLRTINIVRVYFDNERWEDLAPKLKLFWDEVLQKREMGVSAPLVSPEPKTKKSKYDFIDDDD